MLQPSEQTLNLPAPLVAAQATTVLSDRVGPIGAMRGDHLDSPSRKFGVNPLLEASVASLVRGKASREIGPGCARAAAFGKLHIVRGEIDARRAGVVIRIGASYGAGWAPAS